MDFLSRNKLSLKALIVGLLIATTPIASIQASETGAAINEQSLCRSQTKHSKTAWRFRKISSTMENPDYRRSGPQETYHRVWKLVHDNFYDQSFNGQTFSNWEYCFDNEIHSYSDAYRDLALMLDSLKDPYTHIVSGPAFQYEQDSIHAKLQMVGIGITILPRGNRTVVVSTLDNSPAVKEGVQKGDEIVCIDGTSCLGFTQEKIIEKIHGELGTAVDLVVHRDAGIEKTFHLIRAKITLRPVSYKILEAKIGYIKLSSFMPMNTSSEFCVALEALSATDGLIIDLRDNPGGLVSNALEIADMLLNGGAIVETIGRDGLSVERASGYPIAGQVPLVVLVNEDSASASELLAGALKDNKRAIVIGCQTFGKGCVQQIFKLADGNSSLHITVSSFQSPSQIKINNVGITPDINVSDKKLQDEAAVAYLVEYLKQKTLALR